MKKAIYALSADPITYGHINIVERSLKVFDHIIVGIGINSSKKYAFTLEERKELTKKALFKYKDRVTVEYYKGLLTDFAYENQVSTIIRGARNSMDFDFEKMLTDINHGLSMHLDTFILVADQKLSHISSSVVRELQKNNAKNINEYVPLIVKEALERKISDQLLIGITGGIGSGKSYVTKKLINLNKIDNNRVPVSYIDMDEIGRYILKESKETFHISIREKIANFFGKDLINDNKKICVKKLLNIMFDDPEAHCIRNEFEKIMAEPIVHMLRKKMFERKGIILINSALFVESGICDFVNNNIISIECPLDIRIERLKKRGYNEYQIGNRIGTQKTTEERINHIEEFIKKYDCGKLIRIVNKDEDDSDIVKAYNYLIEYYIRKWN
jgi:pantetheine-phosphate adenylyltransferase/dephospho-CoA kinase